MRLGAARDVVLGRRGVEPGELLALEVPAATAPTAPPAPPAGFKSKLLPAGVSTRRAAPPAKVGTLAAASSAASSTSASALALRSIARPALAVVFLARLFFPG